MALSAPYMTAGGSPIQGHHLSMQAPEDENWVPDMNKSVKKTVTSVGSRGSAGLPSELLRSSLTLGLGTHAHL